MMSECPFSKPIKFSVRSGKDKNVSRITCLDHLRDCMVQPIPCVKSGWLTSYVSCIDYKLNIEDLTIILERQKKNGEDSDDKGKTHVVGDEELTFKRMG